MTRNDSPLLLLAEPPARQRPLPRIHLMDGLFLFGALILVLGGALFLIDLAGARSSGQETALSSFFANAATWWPVLMAGAAKYGMLLAASIVNSAFIVLLVTALRTLDRTVGRTVNRRASKYMPMRKMHDLRRARAAAAARAKESQNFLISPVFR